MNDETHHAHDALEEEPYVEPTQPPEAAEPSTGAAISAPGGETDPVSHDAAKPSIGRVVWYTADASHGHLNTYPATVNGAWQNPNGVELDDDWHAHLAVFPTGSGSVRSKTNVPYSAVPEPGTWRWPEILA